MMRVIDLLESINADKIKATFKHGVPMLKVPKAGESQTRQIEIVVEE